YRRDRAGRCGARSRGDPRPGRRSPGRGRRAPQQERDRLDRAPRRSGRRAQCALPVRAAAERATVRRPQARHLDRRADRGRGTQSVLCEGGGALGAKLLVDGLVDRLYWVQAPVWLGEGAVPAFPGVPPQRLAATPRWTPVERRALGSDTLLVLDKRICLPES